MAPEAGRPHMPGYGIEPGPEGLLAWSWAEERLTSTRNYYVATARPDGRPHAMPVWGVWLDGAFWFSTGDRSTKARNLSVNGSCVVTTEGAAEAVIVEGVAEAATDRAALLRMIAVYNEKYSWEMDPDQGGYFIVRPRAAFGFIEAASQFGKTATRWTFEDA